MTSTLAYAIRVPAATLSRARTPHRGEPLSRARALSGIKTPARFSSGRAKRHRLDARTVATAVVEPSSEAARAEEVKLSSNVLPGTMPSNAPPEDRTFVAKGANEATCLFFARNDAHLKGRNARTGRTSPRPSLPPVSARAPSPPRVVSRRAPTRDPRATRFPKPTPLTSALPRVAPLRVGRSIAKKFAVRFIGPDRKGLMAGLTQLMFGCGCNILSSNQYVSEDGMFFQRLSIDFSGLFSGADNREALESNIENMARQFDLDSWDISYNADPRRVGILVSKIDHCLWDLLVRHANGELKCEIPFIISNHTDLKYIADQFGIPFHHLPMEPEKHGGDKAAAKAAQEARIEALVEKTGADTLVMARYMQVLSDRFCDRHAAHTINIHHSFLPAFEGAKPYHRAKERGVKLIGATAHYATAKLDMGPIIVQDVAPVSHRDTVKDMVRKGKDVERVALARALRNHLESRVLVHEGRTVVFD